MWVPELRCLNICICVAGFLVHLFQPYPPPLALLSARMPCIALSCNPGNTSPLYPEPQKIHCPQLLSFWIQLERDEKDLRIHDSALKQHLPLSRSSQLSCLCPVVFTKVKHNLYSREQPDHVLISFNKKLTGDFFLTYSYFLPSVIVMVLPLAVVAKLR